MEKILCCHLLLLAVALLVLILSALLLFSVPLFRYFPSETARSIENAINASPAFATLHTLLCNQDVTVPHLLQKVDTCRFHRRQQHSVVTCSLSSLKEPSFQNLYGQELQFGTPPFTFLYSSSISAPLLVCAVAWECLLWDFALGGLAEPLLELWAPCCPLLPLWVTTSSAPCTDKTYQLIQNTSKVISGNSFRICFMSWEHWKLS